MICVTSCLSTTIDQHSTSLLATNRGKQSTAHVSRRCNRKYYSCELDVKKSYQNKMFESNKNECCDMWEVKKCVKSRCTEEEIKQLMKQHEEGLQNGGITCEEYPEGSKKCESKLSHHFIP